jgi:cytochrome c-type biogenesis protein CcmE
MKLIQKFILPLLILIVGFVIYQFYFSGGGGLDSFDELDPNNSAVKELRVKLINDRGVSQQGGQTIFYASDKNGKVLMVSGEFTLPEGFDKADIIIMRGHLSAAGVFHAHEVLVD